LAKGDIARMQTNLVDIFYHIRQVAARVAKLALRGAFVTRPSFWEGEVVEDQRWYHSKD